MTEARCYEVYLPLKYNDGRSVEPEKFEQTTEELLEKFTGLTMIQHRAETALHGLWKHAGQLYKDEIILYIVYTYETDNANLFFTEYKETLKERFAQLEIFIIAIPIEVF